MTALSWLSDSDALDLLRASDDNAGIVDALATSLPAYVEAATGYPKDLVSSERCDEVVRQMCRVTLQLWYNPDGTDAPQLSAIVDSLAKTVRAMSGDADRS